ncbi:MAG: hypothetical protein IIA27_14410, partial [Gemmatimonadetes bacterium]|nr:hypothetical protein [Gemmatimonadota bacterium]
MAELGVTASEPAEPEPDEPSVASPDEPSVASPEPPADVSAASEAAAPADDGLLIVHGAIEEDAGLENQADQMEGASTGPAEDPEPADDPEPPLIEPSPADQVESAATAPEPDPTPVDDLAPQMIEESFGDQLEKINTDGGDATAMIGRTFSSITIDIWIFTGPGPVWYVVGQPPCQRTGTLWPPIAAKIRWALPHEMGMHG